MSDPAKSLKTLQAPFPFKSRSPMQITQRDKKLLYLLCRHNLLSTKQIQRRIFAELELTTVMRRLRKMEAAGFIVRLGMLPCRTWVWGCSQLSNELFTGFVSSNRTNLHTLYHDVTLSEVRLLVEDLTRVDDWFDVRHIRTGSIPAPFNDEYQRDRYNFVKGDGALVPDALWVGFKQDQSTSWALELELSVKAPSRYRRLMQEYNFRKHPQALLYVVGSDKVRAAVEGMAHWKAHTSCKLYTVRLQDLFKSRDNAVLQLEDRTQARMYDLFDCRTRRDVHQPDQPVDKLMSKPDFACYAAEPSDW